MEFGEIINKLNNRWKESRLAIFPKTSVISPLYPGKLCHCLDEREIYEKYGSLIAIGVEHYQKLQPVIRIEDFKELGDIPGNHLGQFHIGTINGFNSVQREDGKSQYEDAVRSIFSFFDSLGLERAKFKVSYFSGNDAKSIEASRKGGKKRKIKFDKYIPEDDLRGVLQNQGLSEFQLIPVNTRDNYLTSTWYVTEAPWGYRNEIFYQLPNGKFLDIGTIERLISIPEIERRCCVDAVNGDPYAVNLRDWNMNLIIDGVGIERVLQAVEGKENIFQIEMYKPFAQLGYSPKIVEAGKICHRVFSDSSFSDLSPNRKKTVKSVMQVLDKLNSSQLQELLETNACVYGFIHPEYVNTVKYTVEEVEAYRKRRK